MAFTLVVDDSYTHSPTPQIVITVNPVFDDDTGAYKGRRERWKIDGMLIPGGTSITTQVAALKSAYSNTIDKIQMKDNGTVRESIDLSSVEDHIMVKSIDFPEVGGPEWVTKRKYRINIESPLFLESGGSATAISRWKISYNIEQSGLQTRNISGTVEDPSNKEAETAYNALITAQGWLNLAGSNLVSDNYTIDDLNKKVSFTIAHKEYFQENALGSITTSDINVEESYDIMGILKRKISGFFEGPANDCLGVINSLKASGVGIVPLEENIIRNEYTNRTTFSLGFIIGSSVSDVVYTSTSLSIANAMAGFVHRRIIGAYPVKQFTSYPVSTCIQSGRKTGIGQYPDVDAVLYPGDIISRSITQGSVQRTRDGTGYLYPISWTYQFEKSGIFA